MGGPPATPPLTFNPVAGTYNQSGTRVASFSIVASQPVVWNWTVSAGPVPSSSVANGGTATSITFTLSNSTGFDKNSTIDVTVGDQSWTIHLAALAAGGGA